MTRTFENQLQSIGITQVQQTISPHRVTGWYKRAVGWAFPVTLQLKNQLDGQTSTATIRMKPAKGKRNNGSAFVIEEDISPDSDYDYEEGECSDANEDDDENPETLTMTREQFHKLMKYISERRSRRNPLHQWRGHHHHHHFPGHHHGMRMPHFHHPKGPHRFPHGHHRHHHLGPFGCPPPGRFNHCDPRQGFGFPGYAPGHPEHPERRRQCQNNVNGEGKVRIEFL